MAEEGKVAEVKLEDLKPSEIMARMDPWLEEIIWKDKVCKILRRGLGWTAKKKALSAALKFNSDGTAEFNWDVYYKMVLKAVIVKAPFEVDDIMFAGMDAEFGELVERLVPNPFPQISVEQLKKD
jgi:hypothetical protein